MIPGCSFSTGGWVPLSDEGIVRGSVFPAYTRCRYKASRYWLFCANMTLLGNVAR
jgi:hypothetical protein